jgi:hypothetical protein
MTALLILVVVVAATVGVAAWIGRHQRVDLSPAPWDFGDAARREITVLTAQGAVAVTALVLLITLASKSEIHTKSFDTVVVMFLVAFLWSVGVAVQFVYLPTDGGPEGRLIPRLLFVLGGIQHYRTLFLSWLALKPLVDTFGLVEPATILSWLLGASALNAWLIVASISYRTGVLRAGEALIVPAVGIALALPISLAVHRLAPTPSFEDALVLTLTIFILNAVAFGVHAVAPILNRSAGGLRFIEAAARPYVLADLQLTVVAIALLWLTLLRPL